MSAPLTPAEFAQAMAEVIRDNRGDPEAMHSETDCLMEETLSRLGYDEGIAMLELETRWYA